MASGYSAVTITFSAKELKVLFGALTRAEVECEDETLNRIAQVFRRPTEATRRRARADMQAITQLGDRIARRVDHFYGEGS